MPQKRLTFIYIPSDEGQVREYRFAPHLIYGISLVSLCIVLSSAYFAWGFFQKTDQQDALLRLQLSIVSCDQKACRATKNEMSGWD